MSKKSEKSPKTTLDQKSDVLNLSKKRGETPLQTIERYVKAHPEYKGTKMTYAGRLDPMAEGVLVVLTGEKNKERDVYTGLDKDYEFEFILGVETDTHDLLGKITMSILPQENIKKTTKEIEKALKHYKGTFTQKYPAYSSKVVDGMPLFQLARQGRIGVFTLPEHEVVVSKIELIDEKEFSLADFQTYVLDSLDLVDGDFRQAEIRRVWKLYFEDRIHDKKRDSFLVYKARVSCGSGFYVRQLVSDIGRDLGTGAVTTAIHRTRVGNYYITDSIS